MFIEYNMREFDRFAFLCCWFSGKSIVVLLFCDFQVSNISFLIIFFWIPFSGDDYTA